MGGKSGHVEDYEACRMCAAGLYSACPVPSHLTYVVRDRQEHNAMDLQKNSVSSSRLLLHPIHDLPQERVVGEDGCDLGSFSCWAACSLYDRG